MAEPMDDSAEAPPQASLSVSVLQVVRSAQMQHGLRHGDYGRYRSFCTRRLRRLFKGLKFLHGRGKYVKKKLEPSIVLDTRHLHIPLISAERAWAMAMELKAQLEAGPDPAKRRHLIRRLIKASAWAQELARLCEARGDARTALEAEAYAASMLGNLLMERGDARGALAAFTRSKKLVSQLVKVGTSEQQAACRARLEDLEAPLRYCTYQLDRAGAAAPDAAAEPPSPGTSRLESQLQELGTAQASQPAAVADFTWRGTQYPVHVASVQSAIAEAATVQSSLAGTEEQEARLALLDRLGNAYTEIRAAIQSALVNEHSAEPEELKALEVAVRGAALERSMERSSLQARAAEARLARTQQRAAAGLKTKDKERPGKAEDVVRLYDALATYAADLGELAAELGGAAGESLIDEAAAQAAQYQAARCFYNALSCAASNQHAQSYALLHRAAERVNAAIAKHEACDSPNTAAIEHLSALRLAVAGYRCSEHALIAAETAHVAEDVQDISLSRDGDNKQAVVPTDLGSWQSFADGTEQRAVAPLAPGLEAVPVRPILLDSAQEHVAFPATFRRAEQKQEAKSTFSRLFAWR